MKNFLAGIFCGIIVTTVGFSGVANIVDNGIVFIQGWVKTAADKDTPKFTEQKTQKEEPKVQNEEIITEPAEPKESNQ